MILDRGPAQTMETLLMLPPAEASTLQYISAFRLQLRPPIYIPAQLSYFTLKQSTLSKAALEDCCYTDTHKYLHSILSMLPTSLSEKYQNLFDLLLGNEGICSTREEVQL